MSGICASRLLRSPAGGRYDTATLASIGWPSSRGATCPVSSPRRPARSIGADGLTQSAVAPRAPAARARRAPSAPRATGIGCCPRSTRPPLVTSVVTVVAAGATTSSRSRPVPSGTARSLRHSRWPGLDVGDRAVGPGVVGTRQEVARARELHEEDRAQHHGDRDHDRPHAAQLRRSGRAPARQRSAHATASHTRSTSASLIPIHSGSRIRRPATASVMGSSPCVRPNRSPAGELCRGT